MNTQFQIFIYKNKAFVVTKKSFFSYKEKNVFLKILAFLNDRIGKEYSVDELKESKILPDSLKTIFNKACAIIEKDQTIKIKYKEDNYECGV